MSQRSPTSDEPHGRLTRLFVGISATLALLIAAGSAFGYLRYVSVRDVGVIPVFGEPSSSTDPDAEDPPTGPCIEDVCNYLLLGSDSRAGLTPAEIKYYGNDQDIGGENRADTIMLVHTDPNLEKAIILSFPRDLWVEIPGRGWDKINSSFEGGIEGEGPNLVAATIHRLTGLRINHVLYVDLAGFQRVVDTLDGVDMCIPGENVNSPDGRIIDGLTGLDVKPGCQTLPGDQALAYVRTRSLPCDTVPDFSRIARQQQFLRAVINELLRPEELVRLPGMIGPILENLRRDKGLKVADLVFLVGQLEGISTGAAEFRAVPGTGATIDGLSVIRMDPAAQRIFEAIRNGGQLGSVGTQLSGTPISEANIEVPVIDHASGGKVQGVAETLAKSGFDTSSGTVTYEAYGEKVTGSWIAYAPGHEVEAQVVKKYFPTLQVMEVDGLSDHVAVFITGSYRPAPVGAGQPTCVDPNA